MSTSDKNFIMSSISIETVIHCNRIFRRKEDSNSNSPDLQMTIAGSTFYGLSASQSTVDMSSSSSNQDMGDYRRAIDR